MKLSEIEPILDIDYINAPVPPDKEMILLETKFEKLENEMEEVIKSTDELKQTWQELNQSKHVLIKAHSFLRKLKLPLCPSVSYHGHHFGLT